MKFIIPPSAKSRIEVDPNSHFPIQNLPFGFAQLDEDAFSVVIRIGDQVLVLQELVDMGMLEETDFPDLDQILDLNPTQLRYLRRLAFDLLRDDSPQLKAEPDLLDDALLPISAVEMLLPMQVATFTDFYSGINHASHVGRLFRPEGNPLPPAYRHIPLAYVGRASGVIGSGEDVYRPKGVFRLGEDAVFQPTGELDFELELGAFIGKDHEPGSKLTPSAAEDLINGLVLVNDWSARDIQAFESIPLGPHMAKSFATSVSPWLVTLDALEPFRVAGPEQDPKPLPHLRQRGQGHFNLVLEAWLQPHDRDGRVRITEGTTQDIYWSFGQQIAHAASNGAPLEIGDLMASGTISGTEPGTYGCLLEATARGRNPIDLGDGTRRTYLEDGDSITLTGYAQGEEYRVGFGELTNTIVSE